MWVLLGIIVATVIVGLSVSVWSIIDTKKVVEKKSNCLQAPIRHSYPCDYEYGCHSCPDNCKNR